MMFILESDLRFKFSNKKLTGTELTIEGTDLKAAIDVMFKAVRSLFKVDGGAKFKFAR
jgi:hypothetical protein